MKRLAIICLVAIAAPALQAPPGMRSRDAKKFVGKDVTLCGRVVSTDCSHAKDVVFLRLDQIDNVSLGVRSAERQTFGQRFEDHYLGADVCAAGRMERVDKQYVVVVNAPSSITFPGPHAAPADVFAPAAVRPCAADVQEPILQHEVEPAYTEEAMRALVQGVLVLDALVLPDGTVGNVRVIRSLDRQLGLDDQGIQAVRQWQFTPGTVRGQVVPMIVNIELSFTLK
jgi:TonB family protein